ncbi:MAG: bifunctional tetrahydrofolate synthase/dihydrofolate synthase [Gammaproteobacteria bacterium]
MKLISPENPRTSTPLRFNTLDEWLTWQGKLHFTAIELGLERCRKVAESMKLLPPAYFVISIAGTNGKGSCAVMLENILRTAGYKVGIYTSPHLVRYNERIRINGEQVSDADLCRSFNQIDQARDNISLTYFEFGTLAAMDLFQARKIDVAIMEVGLGGRLDAVNMLDANVALVSTIDIDHEQWLGHDRDSIGREKSGIFRPMRPAVCADPDPPSSLSETANLVGANLVRSGHDFFHEVADNAWSWRSGLIHYDRLPLPGNQVWQIQNASGVLMVIQAISDYFPVEQETIFNGFRDFNMPGRFQVIPGEVPLILDVAHNRQSANTLAENLQKLPAKGKNLVVLGMLKDKNHTAFITSLAPVVDKWYVTGLEEPRGAASSELAGVINSINPDAVLFEFPAVSQALLAAQGDAVPGDRIIVTGSFVTVGDTMNQLDIGV